MKFLLLLLGCLVQVRAGQAIYSYDHWEYSTKLTEDNFDDFISSSIQQDKTVFVRWIGTLARLACCLFGLCNSVISHLFRTASPG